MVAADLQQHRAAAGHPLLLLLQTQKPLLTLLQLLQLLALLQAMPEVVEAPVCPVAV